MEITKKEIGTVIYLLLLFIGFTLIKDPIIELFQTYIPWLNPLVVGIALIIIVILFWRVNK